MDVDLYLLYCGYCKILCFATLFFNSKHESRLLTFCTIPLSSGNLDS